MLEACSVLQCVAVRSSALQCVAVRCSVLCRHQSPTHEACRKQYNNQIANGANSQIAKKNWLASQANIQFAENPCGRPRMQNAGSHFDI